jgi:ACR3 family arsenite transporter
MLTRLQLDRWQVLIYIAALLAGCALGLARPDGRPLLEAALWPVLAALLYVSFAQVPLLEIAGVLRDTRFLRALLAANFVAVPVLVWLLVQLLPSDPALVFGVYLVLLVPCTDWYVSFTLLGRGDARRAIASTPVLLLAQMIALPFYLWLFLGREFLGVVRPGAFLHAFLGLILLPLVLAALTEAAARRRRLAARWLEATGWMPVPLLSLTVLIIAGAQVGVVMEYGLLLGRVAAVFALYAAVVPVVARWIGRRCGLDVGSQRTLIFSAGTRNSFVVLPFALMLSEELKLAVAVIVLQSLVELVALVLYLRWIPRHLVPDVAGGR